VAWAEAYLRTKWDPDPSSRLARIDMGQKVGDAILGNKRGLSLTLDRGIF